MTVGLRCLRRRTLAAAPAAHAPGVCRTSNYQQLDVAKIITLNVAHSNYTDILSTKALSHRFGDSAGIAEH